MPSKRTVHYTDATKSAKWSRTKLYAFDVHAIAQAANCSTRTVFRAARDGKLTLHCLRSVAEWIARPRK